MNSLPALKRRDAKIREWEAVRNLSFDATTFKMLDAAAGFFAEPANKNHFSYEIGRGRSIPNITKFLRSIHRAMKASLKAYIYHELGYSNLEKRAQRLNWEKTEKILRQMHNLLLKIPKQNTEQISSSLKEHAFPTLNDKVRSSIKRSLMISAAQRRRFDLRGNKKSGVSVLARALFENLEWELERNLARSFMIRPSRKYMLQHPEQKLSRDFVNLDAKLIYHLVKTVIPSAAIETVQSALKNMPPRAS